MTTKLTNASASLAADAICDTMDSGVIKIYSGTEPATADTALSGNTLLAQLTFNAAAFGAASNGVSTAGAITGDSSADATGTATFFRVETSGGTVRWQGNVGATSSGSALELSSTSIVAGGQVNVSSWTFTVPKS